MAQEPFEATYLQTHAQGLLQEKIETAIRWLEDCTICPRNCKVNRTKGEKGFCEGGYLPKISSLKDYQPPVITTVYSDDNRKIAEFFKERRIVIPLSQMPNMLKEAFIAAEDSRFYKHKGIDFFSSLVFLLK